MDTREQNNQTAQSSDPLINANEKAKTQEEQIQEQRFKELVVHLQKIKAESNGKVTAYIKQEVNTNKEKVFCVCLKYGYVDKKAVELPGMLYKAKHDAKLSQHATQEEAIAFRHVINSLLV